VSCRRGRGCVGGRGREEKEGRKEERSRRIKICSKRRKIKRKDLSVRMKVVTKEDEVKDDM
jgi:hypothetical protein